MKFTKKEIIYPIFLQVSQMATDSFWIYLFQDLAYGICPFGISIDNYAVYCRFKDKQFNYNFSGKSCQNIYDQLMHIFKNKLNILSKLDHLTKRSKFNEILQLISNKQWKDIRKKNIKDILLENFVISLKYKYSLSNTQAQKILNSIIIGFTFKLISNTDVIYDPINCKIIDINGIDFQLLEQSKKITMSLDMPKPVCETNNKIFE